jgi:hypothetical protein
VHPIDELKEQYADISADAVRLIETQPAVRLTSRPHPTRWSAVECLQHLTVSAERFAPLVEEAIEKARHLPPADRPYRVSLMGRLLLWMLEPPVRLRFPTPPSFQPSMEQSPEEALQAFLTAHGRLVELLESGRGLALDQVEIISPFARNVRYNVWSTFLVAAAHDRRHLWQAHQAVAL